MEQKLLFGLTLETSQKVREDIETELNRKIPGIQSVCRYRKEGVYQYLAQQQEGAVVIIEETLQGGSPYTTEELQQLSDLGGQHIIYLMDSAHYGDDYAKELYCCGIYDALYIDQLKAKEVLKLIFQGRTCSQAREYYGIRNLRDAERKYNIVNEDQLSIYLEFIEEGGSAEEITIRYRFASERLGVEENRVLVASITRPVAECLSGNEIYQYYKGSAKDKRIVFPRIGRKKQGGDMHTVQPVEDIPQNESVPLSEMCAARQTGLAEGREHNSKDRDRPKNLPCPAGEDDMLDIMDRFRLIADEGRSEAVYQQEEDLREVLGEFFRTIDV